ncbi:MAG: hypothetical protein IIC24_04895, partial [Chloroflexi bacterium]|nr:hypothetical protein [Chloroflexota bacterium]
MAVTQLEITSRTAFADGESFGDVGPYNLLEGTAHFTVDPDHPRNEAINDLKLAPRDSNGQVRFSAGFAMLQPADPENGNRRIIFDLNDKLQLQDADGDRIGDIGGTTLLKDTDYFFYWYINLLGTTRDIVWIRTSTTWSKEIDVSGHGDIGTFVDDMKLTLGSGSGKTLPTSGGPMYYDDFCIIVNPTTALDLGSPSCKYLAANGDGADATFTDQDFNDVDEGPADLDGLTIDSGNAANERNSYDVASPGETPLAMFPSGVGRETASGIEARPYIYDPDV